MDGSLIIPTKKSIVKRWTSLKMDRASYDAHYQALARYVLPRSSRFTAGQRNQQGGQNLQNSIIDNTGTRGLRTLCAGLMSGLTSPSRPWFMLRAQDEEVNKNHDAKMWLSAVTDIMLRIFNKSNTYNALHSIYRELGLYGTAASFQAPNYDRVVHHYTNTVGEYALAQNNLGEIDTVYREFDISVDAAVQWWGKDNLSQSWQNAYDNSNGDRTFTVIHAVQPRRDRDEQLRDAKNMPFASIYAELGGDEGKLLSVGGFKTFPAYCPRWDAMSTDTYGASPGMDALGDIMQLQQEQYRKSEGIDFMVRPPLQVPNSMRDSGSSFLPGGISYYDGQPTGGVRSAFDVNLNLEHLTADIGDTRQRIMAAFYADVFTMLSQNDDPRMTATEVAERHEEKLLMLGPVLERLNVELLIPLIENTFARVVETGIAPPPPASIHMAQIQIEFVSILAQAQRAIGVNAVDRFVSNIGAIAAVKPNILDRFDEDAWVDYYADALGVDPSLIVAGDKAAMIRNARAQQQQQQTALAAAQQGADAAKSGAQAAQAASAAGVQLPVNAGYTVGGASERYNGPSLPPALMPNGGV